MIRLCALLRVRTGFEHFKHFVCINDGVNLLFFFFFFYEHLVNFKLSLPLLTHSPAVGRSFVRSIRLSIRESLESATVTTGSNVIRHVM
jgi:hypothetical protein